MRFGGIYNLDASVSVLLLIGVMMLAAEVGYRVGLRRYARTGERGRGHFAGVLGSMLGLVALLLGFTFNMSLQRYEMRRQLVIEDANVLSVLYQSSSRLPEAERASFNQKLREYVDLRTDAAIMKAALSEEEISKRIRRTDELQRLMWEQMLNLAQANPPVAGADAMLTLLERTQSVHRQRLFAYQGRVPEAIIVLLLGAATIGMGAVGWAGGLWEYRGMSARIMLVLLLSGTIFIILELDQPRHGCTSIDLTPMVQMRMQVMGVPEKLP